MGFMFPANGKLGRFGNSAAWWLGIQPYELFFYVFLPPLLLDAAVRIDFFLFKKVWQKIARAGRRTRRAAPVAARPGVARRSAPDGCGWLAWHPAFLC